MNSTLPPRASYTMGTQFKSPVPETHHQRSVAATTTDASPAFPDSRSPLGPVGVNGAGLGLRQRRPEPGSNNMNGPPRASLTMMSMGAKAAPTASTTAAADDGKPGAVNDLNTEEYWVLVYGVTDQTRDEVLAQFRQVGNVVEERMGSRHSNWLAVSYETALTVEKALCLSPLHLRNGNFCGVNRLPESRKFFLAHQATYGAVIAKGNDGANKPSRGLFPNATKDTTVAAENAKELEEEDILITKTERDSRKKQTVCEKFMAWVYGW